MRNLVLRAGMSAALLFMCLGFGGKAWGDGRCASDRSIPVAQQDGLFEAGLHVLFIPIDIVNAVTLAPGETYSKGDTTKGQYARNGYNRYYARWYDPFLYYHN